MASAAVMGAASMPYTLGSRNQRQQSTMAEPQLRHRMAAQDEPARPFFGLQQTADTTAAAAAAAAREVPCYRPPMPTATINGQHMDSYARDPLEQAAYSPRGDTYEDQIDSSPHGHRKTGGNGWNEDEPDDPENPHVIPGFEPSEPPLIMPPDGRPCQALFSFLGTIRTRYKMRFVKVDKSLPQWQRMAALLDHPLTHKVDEKHFTGYEGQVKGGGNNFGQRFTMRCEMPTKSGAQEIMRLVEQYWADRPDQPFKIPPAVEKRITYEPIDITLRGLTAVLRSVFWPEGYVSFEENPSRKAAANASRKIAKRDSHSGRNACIKAGATHGTSVHRQLEIIVDWLYSGKNISPVELVARNFPRGLDYCTLRILAYLDESGRLPIRSEFLVGDPLLAIGTPIDLICWQCEGFDPERRVGCHFMELKTGYDCGSFDEPMPGDRFMKHLTGLYDTPYMRAVLQLIFSCAFVFQRYGGYVSEEQSILKVSSKTGFVEEYGMPGWVEDEKNCAFMYECAMPYVPVAHRRRVCSGLRIPCQQLAGVPEMTTEELAALAGAAAGFIPEDYDASDWSYLSVDHLDGNVPDADMDTTTLGGYDEGNDDYDGGYDSEMSHEGGEESGESSGEYDSDMDEASYYRPRQSTFSSSPR